MSTQSIDLAGIPRDDDDLQIVVARLLDDLTRGELSPAPIAYRDAHRWVQTYEPIRQVDLTKHSRLRERGVYLITGGLGGVGLAIADYLARTVQARLVLVGRSAFPPVQEWDRWLAEHDDDDMTSARIRQVRALEAHGAEVAIQQADVTDRAVVVALIEAVRHRFGALHGVIHAAGVPGDGVVQLKVPAVAASVLAPKVHGSLYLADALRDTGCDFLVFCSSQTAIIGGAGQVDYCAANAFQDALANARADHRSPTILSINWDVWQEAGMAVSYKSVSGGRAIHAEVIADGLRSEEGAQAFAVAVETELPQVIVSVRDFVGRVDRWTGPAQEETAATPGEAVQQLARHQRPALATAFVEPRDALEQRIAAVWGELLGLEQVGVHDSFFDLGGHSLLGLRLAARLQETFAVSCSLKQIFSAPTVAELAVFLREATGDAGTPEADDADMLALIDQLSEQEIEALLATTQSQTEGP